MFWYLRLLVSELRRSSGWFQVIERKQSVIECITDSRKIFWLYETFSLLSTCFTSWTVFPVLQYIDSSAVEK